MLIQKGYKVARIEQTETPDMMTERVKNSKYSSKLKEQLIINANVLPNNKIHCNHESTKEIYGIIDMGSSCICGS